MKITANRYNPYNKNNKPQSFKGLYNNKLLLKSLGFAADYPALFSGTLAFLLSAIARPLAILSTPKTDKENKKYACAKALASNAGGYLLMAAASIPVSNAVIIIDKKPSKFINEKTIKMLKKKSPDLIKSKYYQFATQLFKLGLGMLIALPKSALTCFLIPPVMSLFFKNKKHGETQHKQNSNVISFKGMYNSATEKLAKSIGKIINTKPFQKFVNRYADTDFALHIMNLTDTLLTGSFIAMTAKSKKIKQERKKALIYNSAISTGLSIAGSYVVNKYTEKPVERFINKFKEVNKNSPVLEKYVEGIKIAKPALILGGIYYIIIPVISTFFADRADKKHNIKLY